MELFLRGTGMCTMTAFMLTYFLPIPIRCGGTGVGIGACPVHGGDSDGAGVLPIIIAVGTGRIIMQVIGAVMTRSGIRDGEGIRTMLLITAGQADTIVRGIPIIAHRVMQKIGRASCRERVFRAV